MTKQYFQVIQQRTIILLLYYYIFMTADITQCEKKIVRKFMTLHLTHQHSLMAM